MLIIIVLVYKYYGIQNAFTYTFDITTISGDFTHILSNLFNNEVKKLNVSYLVDLTNKSTETISFSNLKIYLSTIDGFVLGQTPNTPDNLKVTVLKGGQRHLFTGSLDMLLNGTTVNIASKVLTGEPINIVYKIKLNVILFSIIPVPVWYKDTFEYKK